MEPEVPVVAADEVVEGLRTGAKIRWVLVCGDVVERQRVFEGELADGFDAVADVDGGGLVRADLVEGDLGISIAARFDDVDVGREFRLDVVEEAAEAFQSEHLDLGNVGEAVGIDTGFAAEKVRGAEIVGESGRVLVDIDDAGVADLGAVGEADETDADRGVPDDVTRDAEGANAVKVSGDQVP